MKINRYTEIVPEHKIEHVEYIASDGTVFSEEGDCRDYERKLNERQLSVSASMFESGEPIYDWYNNNVKATLYLIITTQDYDYLINHIEHGTKEQDDFYKFGPGFYLLVVTSKGFSKYTYRLHYLDYYLKLIEMEHSNWLQDIERTKSNIMKSLKNIISEANLK